MRTRPPGPLAGFLLLVLLSVGPATPAFAAASTPDQSTPIKHIIIFVQENHTFDNYFGTFPGANGVGSAKPQFSSNGTSYLPYEIPQATLPKDLCHENSCALADYANGTMNGFVKGEKNKMTMGYFNPKLIAYYWDYASQYVLMDNYYTSVLAPSLPNHIYMLAGQSGGLLKNNLTFKFNFPTIVDTLDAAHVSWRYYAGVHYITNDWNPLPSVRSFVKAHPNLDGLGETSEFQYDLLKPSFPSVAWVMPPADELSEHPPYNITKGELNLVNEINLVMKSQYWSSTAIIVTWDDYGGWYDHAPPPQLDKYGLGFRVPALIVSPYAKHGFVDHTLSEHASTLRFIETVFNLPSLGTRDAQASNLMEAFNFQQQPRHPMPLPGAFLPHHYPLKYLNGTTLGPLPSGQPGQVYVYNPWPDEEYTAALVIAVSAFVFLLAIRARRPAPTVPVQTESPVP